MMDCKISNYKIIYIGEIQPNLHDRICEHKLVNMTATLLEKL